MATSPFCRQQTLGVGTSRMNNSGNAFMQRQSPSGVPAPIHGQNSESLVDMLTVMVEGSGQAHNDPASHIERLDHEYKQLQASKLQSYVPTPVPANDPLSQTTPSMPSGSGKDVGLRELMERELKAARELEARRSESAEPGNRFRSQSLAYRGVATGGGAMADRGSRALPSDRVAIAKQGSGARTDNFNAVQQLVSPDLKDLGAKIERGLLGVKLGRSATTERGPDQQEQVDSLSAQVNHLKKELEKKELELQHSTQENSKLSEDLIFQLQDKRKLSEEKAACVAAHERDVANLEHRLSTIMAENKTLKEALSGSAADLEAIKEAVAMVVEKNAPKLNPSVLSDGVERLMTSTLIQLPSISTSKKGISTVGSILSTPLSTGSVSTEPELEPDR